MREKRFNEIIHIENNGKEIKKINLKITGFHIFLSYHPQAFRFLICYPSLLPDNIKAIFDKTTFIIIEIPFIMYYGNDRESEGDFITISLKNRNEIIYQFKINLYGDELDFDPNQYIVPLTEIIIYFLDIRFYKFKSISCEVIDRRRPGDIFPHYYKPKQ